MKKIETIHKISRILIETSILCLIILLNLFLYQQLSWKPYDDLTNHLSNPNEWWKSVNCSGNKCTIEFDSKVKAVYQIATTGSDVPVVGGNDVVICLDTKPKLGDLVDVGVLHLIYKIENGWGQTRGTNWLAAPDLFKFPLNNTKCVVGAVIR
jgi:hypothetical protein